MAAVTDLLQTGLSVEQQILVNEIIAISAGLQAVFDADRERRERHAARVRESRSRTVTHSESPPIPPEGKIKNIKTPQSPLAEPLGFAEWYSAFPRREARRAAEKAYRHAVKRGATPECLLESAKRYALEVAGRERQYIKTPAAWLNADCWRDESNIVPWKPPVVLDAPKKTWAEIQAEKKNRPDHRGEKG